MQYDPDDCDRCNRRVLSTCPSTWRRFFCFSRVVHTPAHLELHVFHFSHTHYGRRPLPRSSAQIVLGPPEAPIGPFGQPGNLKHLGGQVLIHASLAGLMVAAFNATSDLTQGVGWFRWRAPTLTRETSFMRTNSVALVFGAVTLLFNPQTGIAITIFDGTFVDSNWTHTKVFDDTGGGATFTTAQVASGGNPGAYQGGSHTWGPGSIYVAHVYTGGGSYDPSIQGAISSLDFSHDFEVSSTGHVATALLLEQSGIFFIAPSAPPYFDFVGASWTSASGNFAAADFKALTSSGIVQGTPDFSATAAPIEFGYATLNTTSFTGRVTTWGIDNYSVTVNAVPEPSALALVGGTLVGLLGLVRQRTRLNSGT